MEKLFLIIPAYNEEKRIGRTLEEYIKFFNQKKKEEKLDYKILIVINNTKDKTQEVVNKFSKKNKSIISINLKKGGKGNAVREGFKESLKTDSTLIGFVDADLATPPESYYDLILNIKDLDAVIANRDDYRSKTTTSLKRKITSKGFNLIVRSIMLFPYRDTQCGAKLFKRKVIEKISSKLDIAEWAFDIDLLYNIRKYGFKIKQVPTTWEDVGGSKLSLFIVPIEMFLSIIRLRILYSPFQILIRAYDLIPDELKLHKIYKKWLKN